MRRVVRRKVVAATLWRRFRDAVATVERYPRARRLALVVVGVALGASCPHWPTPLRPLCATVATLVNG